MAKVGKIEEERRREERRGASWGNMGDGESSGQRERAAGDGDNGRGVRLQPWFSAAKNYLDVVDCILAQPVRTASTSPFSPFPLPPPLASAAAAPLSLPHSCRSRRLATALPSSSSSSRFAEEKTDKDDDQKNDDDGDVKNDEDDDVKNDKDDDDNDFDLWSSCSSCQFSILRVTFNFLGDGWNWRVLGILWGLPASTLPCWTSNLTMLPPPCNSPLTVSMAVQHNYHFFHSISAPKLHVDN
ncbi:hypothetical protein Droror1_Dr00027413 [Drosera rotundifolia]